MNPARISKIDWAMELARVTARRSTCLRRAVGCVLLDRQGRVLATGYNGVASGEPHCNEIQPGSDDVFPHACPGALAPSGQQLDACLAIHAEQNALLQCGDPDRIYSCYVTTSPCMTCTKLLLNTGCQLIFFDQEYVQREAQELWTRAGRGWVKAPTAPTR